MSRCGPWRTWTRRPSALLKKSPRPKVLVGFERAGERYLTVVEIGAASPDDPPRDARKAWVPITVQVLTPPLAERLGLKGRTGVRVTRVLDDKTPLRVGDVILAIDGESVRATASMTMSCSARRSAGFASGRRSG